MAEKGENMESTKSEPTGSSKVPVRAIRHQSEPSVSTVIATLLDVLGIKDTMLAALLRVTERTLPNWKTAASMITLSGKGKRLIALDYVVQQALAAGVPKDELLNLLDHPFDPNRDDSLCLLTLIVNDETQSGSFNPLVKKQIDDFVRNNP